MHFLKITWKETSNLTELAIDKTTGERKLFPQESSKGLLIRLVDENFNISGVLSVNPDFDDLRLTSRHIEIFESIFDCTNYPNIKYLHVIAERNKTTVVERKVPPLSTKSKTIISSRIP